MRASILLLLFATSGCLDGVITPSQFPRPGTSDTPTAIHAPLVPGDVFSTLNGPIDAHKELCDNDGSHPQFPDDADRITKVFCQDLVPGGAIPKPTGLGDLLALLGLDIKDPGGENGQGGNPGFAILGHSSALTARNVTSITPTVFFFTPPAPDGSAPPGFVFLAFNPGEQFVEVASHDPVAGEVNFYLVTFEKECTQAPGGCTPNDVLTPNLVTGWSNVRQFESSTALNNTIADCRQCHAPVDSKPQILRMQEIEAPFTHWFSKDTEGGRALLEDFHAAHGTTEDYGGLPAALIDKSDPSKMAAMITAAGFAEQPNAFPSTAIEAEIKATAPMQPVVNVPPGASDSWRALYERAVAGQVIAPPYHDVKTSDPSKLAAMTSAYREFQSGKRATLPDIRDVFLDQALRDLSFAPKRATTGRQLLQQTCQQCHNVNLDPMISRDKFLVDRLDQMSREEKDLAIERLLFDPASRLFMPPLLFHTVTDAERDLMVAELRN